MLNSGQRLVLVLVLVLNKDPLAIKRMLTLRHPYTRASFLCQGLQSDTEVKFLGHPGRLLHGISIAILCMQMRTVPDLRFLLG